VTNIKENPAKDLKDFPKGSLEFLKLDLNDLTTIKPAAQELLAKVNRLDIASYNAGVMTPPVGSKTAQVRTRQSVDSCVPPVSDL
jgi:retinol dehydrogenase-12